MNWCPLTLTCYTLTPTPRDDIKRRGSGLVKLENRTDTYWNQTEPL